MLNTHTYFDFHDKSEIEYDVYGKCIIYMCEKERERVYERLDQHCPSQVLGFSVIISAMSSFVNPFFNITGTTLVSMWAYPWPPNVVLKKLIRFRVFNYIACSFIDIWLVSISIQLAD